MDTSLRLVIPASTRLGDEPSTAPAASISEGTDSSTPAQSAMTVLPHPASPDHDMLDNGSSDVRATFTDMDPAPAERGTLPAEHTNVPSRHQGSGWPASGVLSAAGGSCGLGSGQPRCGMSGPAVHASSSRVPAGQLATHFLHMHDIGQVVLLSTLHHLLARLMKFTALCLRGDVLSLQIGKRLASQPCA